MEGKKKRGIHIPHMFTLILLIITVCTILTYIIPAGEYDRVIDENGTEMLVADSYHRVEQTPVSVMGALKSVQKGFIATAYLGISQQKRYLEGNIHGILKDGGTLPNIIPDYACLQYYVRCAYEWQTKAAVERLTRCAQGAADSVGATLKTTNYLAPFKPLLLNEHLYLAMEENLRALGVEFSQEFTVMGSTDMGDVSFKIPAIHLMLGIKGCEQMDAHTKEFAAATVSENGRNATRSGVCALAFTAYDLLTNPKLLAAVKADFQKALQEQHKKGV